MAEASPITNYQSLGSEATRPKNVLALLVAVLGSALAFTTTQTIQFAYTEDCIFTQHTFAFGELAGAVFLGLIPCRIWLKLVIGTICGLVGAVIFVVLGLLGIGSVTTYIIGRLAFGAWAAGSMLASINYMTQQADFFNIGAAQAIGHLGGALLSIFVLPDQDSTIIGVSLLVIAVLVLVLSFPSKFDLVDSDEETERGGATRGVFGLLILCILMFSSTLTEEPLAQNLPTGDSTLGWGSDTALYWHIISGIIALIAMICGNCAELGPRKIIGFATGFAAVGFFALIDLENRNANIAGFFTSLAFLSFSIPLGKFGSLAALKELKGQGLMLALYYLIGAAIRCCGSIWVVREITLYDPLQVIVLAIVLASSIVVYLCTRNDLSWYDIEYKKNL